MTTQLAAGSQYTFVGPRSNTMFIDFEVGSVNVEASMTNDEITIFWLLLEGVANEFVVEAHEAEELTLSGKRQGTSIGPLNVQVNVTAPKACSLEMQNDGGSIRLVSRSGRTAVKIKGGNATLVDDWSKPTVVVEGGDIHVEQAHAGGDFWTIGGSVHVTKNFGKIVARADGGGIVVQYATTPEGDLKATGGSVEVSVPKSEAFELSATVSGGGITLIDLISPGEIRVGSFDGPINGGGTARLDIEVNGGGVRVRGI